MTQIVEQLKIIKKCLRGFLSIIITITNILINFLYYFLLSLIDKIIARIQIQRVLDVSSEWTEAKYETDNSSTLYEFRVTCDAQYYGTGCKNLCRPRDDQFGHSTCSSTGERLCLAGWQGEYCDKRKFLEF